MITVTTPENFSPDTRDMGHINATMVRAFQWNTPENNVTVEISPRNAEGWLEYNLVVRKINSDKLVIYIACIQRQPGAESEFHS